MFWISLALIVLFVVMAMFPQLFTSKDPTFADLTKARRSPSAEAVFGYDAQGYDVYARTVYGARASIRVGVLATLFSLVFGPVRSASSPVTAAAGWTRCSAASPRSS